MRPQEMELITYPNPILTTPGEEVTEFGDNLKRCVRRMFKIMRQGVGKQKGLGLAAHQVGWPVRLFVMHVKDPFRETPEFTLINPKILSYSEEKIKAQEGCLSFPGKSKVIERAKSVTVEFQEYGGRLKIITFHDLSARVVQHEYDHINGILCLEDKPCLKEE